MVALVALDTIKSSVIPLSMRHNVPACWLVCKQISYHSAIFFLHKSLSGIVLPF